MPFPFSLICELLEASHAQSLRRKESTQTVTDWFARHRSSIDAHDTNFVALLSTLLPEKRTDRVYCIQVASLEKIIGRALMLGSSRMAELATYKKSGLGLDLADSVEQILLSTPNPLSVTRHVVTVEAIDNVLHSLASRVKWSSPSIRASSNTLTSRNRGDLEALYRRLSPVEAKWFTRLILKDFRPVIFDPSQIYRSCDPLLPLVLNIMDDYYEAVRVVQAARTRLLPSARGHVLSRQHLLTRVKPKIGVKVGRQYWHKARSIKHCLEMGHGRMSVEQKVDGEYCQIHIDISNRNGPIQIFSKSGKDSTTDREAVHRNILESLRLGQADCHIRKHCILEGELVVYNDLEKRIMPFHKIRKYVTRRGLCLGTQQDSPPRLHERLMIVYYDVLLLNDDSLLGVRHSDRFKVLERIISRAPGRAELVQRQVIDFGRTLAASDLRRAFAQEIVSKGEGLVLKPDGPYFSVDDRRPYRHGYCIKLKKEYIGHFGDVGDFAIVGAGFDPGKAKTYRIPHLKWTHFYIGCLQNKDEVKRWHARPEFKVINMVELNDTILRMLIRFGNPMPVPYQENTTTALEHSASSRRTMALTVAFTNPLVCDVKCFSFDKEGDTDFWSLRFPAVTKLHFDRDYTDTVSFDELQKMASDATAWTGLEDSQENLQWIAMLEGADPRAVAVDAASQLTNTTIATASPCTSPSYSPKLTQANSSRRSSRRRSSPSSLVNSTVFQERISSQVACVTPAVSSAVAGSTSGAGPVSSHLERSPFSSPVFYKRRKTCHQSSSDYSHQREPSPVSRRPLESTDGNRSQPFTPPYSRKRPVNTTSVAVDIIDLDSSTDESSFVKTEMGAKWSQQGNAATKIQGGVANSGQICTEDAHSCVQVSLPPPNTSSSHRQKTELSAASDPGEDRSGCKYAGTDCQLAGIHVLVYAELHPAAKACVAQLQAHGAGDIITKPEEWIKTELDSHTPIVKEAPCSRVLLLVDSMESNVKTRALLQRLDRSRSQVDESKRVWIEVYDWRVIDYLTILEDESITNKYYGGFSSPWRRWYCGLV
ncbi:hypothetical protein S40288_09426 [Stachybotrys chartarum IBT 40288]|nr:hypothetical protein S40288_09426 [Stachybotrys chartarum IBT 40288]